MTRLTRLLIAIALVLAVPAAATAQQGQPFAPRVFVNDRAITNFEVEQRIRLMAALNSPGDLPAIAYRDLIDDRLRIDESIAMGIQINAEGLDAGMAEFASRGGASLEEFLQFVGAQGVAPETFRDFVLAGLAWRAVVQTKFGPKAQVTEDEIDRAIALSTRAGGAKILMSEIILRADTPEFRAQSQELALELSHNLKSAAAFAEAARAYSVSQSASIGGRIDWLDLSLLPQAVASQVLSLGPGEVSEPIPLPSAIGLFQLRAIEENDLREPASLAVEYARLLLPVGGTGQAAKLAEQADTCDDLYGLAQKMPPEQLIRDTQTVSDIPGDLALALAKLDSGESAILNRENAVELVMLCARTPQLGEEFDRAALRQQLITQRLNSYSESYLAELRADAIIREP